MKEIIKTMNRVESWRILKEEHDSICELENKQLKAGKTTKELARRMLLFTELLFFKGILIEPEDVTEEIAGILKDLRINNQIMGEKHAKFMREKR